MTKRTEFQQRSLELKSQVMAWVANRLFSFKQDGLDGFLKRQLTGKQKTSKQSSKKAAPTPQEA